MEHSCSKEVKHSVSQRTTVTTIKGGTSSQSSTQTSYNLRKRKLREENDYNPNKSRIPKEQIPKRLIKRPSAKRAMAALQWKQRSQKYKGLQKNMERKKKNVLAWKERFQIEKLNTFSSNVTDERKRSTALKGKRDLNLKTTATEKQKAKTNSGPKRKSKTSKTLQNDKDKFPKLKESNFARKARQSSAKLNCPEKSSNDFKSLKNVSPVRRKFPNMFLKRLDVKTQINVGINSDMDCISVTHDNLVWVNYFEGHAILFDSSGKVLRSVELNYGPVFSSCTPNGDLLVTQGYGANTKPTLGLISREGNVRVLADLSAHAKNLYGVLYQDDKIYVTGYSSNPNKYTILTLTMSGEVEKIYETKPKSVKINRIISKCGQIFATFIDRFDLHPLMEDHVSSEGIQKISVESSSSGTASVDNFGNIIVAASSGVIVINPELDSTHQIRFKIPVCVKSLAVDHQNQLWVGTDDGTLYITRYLRK